MLADFVHRAPTRLVFGRGSADKAGIEAASLGLRSVLMVSGRGPTLASPGYARVRASLEKEGIRVESFSEVGHDPSVEEVEALATRIRESAVEGLLAYGGGSPMDCAKSANLLAANALAPDAPHSGAGLRDYLYGRRSYGRRGLPLIALPTTAGSGSEMSAAAVTTDHQARRKIGVSSDLFFPTVAIVDPELQAGMPPGLTAATGMDALTHAVESFVSRNATPISRALAGLAAGLIVNYLHQAHTDGANLDARGAMALGSSIVGVAFSQSGLGMVHGFAHPLGSICGIAHGTANAVMLPRVMRAAARAVPEPFALLARDFGLSVEGLDSEAAALRCVERVESLSRELGIPARLAELGVPRSELPAILADAKAYRNRGASPHAFTDEELAAILESAY